MLITGPRYSTRGKERLKCGVANYLESNSATESISHPNASMAENLAFCFVVSQKTSSSLHVDITISSFVCAQFQRGLGSASNFFPPLLFAIRLATNQRRGSSERSDKFSGSQRTVVPVQSQRSTPPRLAKALASTLRFWKNERKEEKVVCAFHLFLVFSFVAASQRSSLPTGHYHPHHCFLPGDTPLREHPLFECISSRRW